MTELEPGHPDELCTMLANWLDRANDPIGSLPQGMPPNEWAVRNFINSWRKPVRVGIDSIELSLSNARDALNAGDTERAAREIECALQTLAEDIRDELGIYDWNNDGD